MRTKLTRRRLLGTIAACVATGSAYAGAPGVSLRPPDQPLRTTGLTTRQAPMPNPDISGRVSWAVADIKTGLQLESENGGQALPPASVAKALTAVYALETLGGDHRFRTAVLAAGQITDGILDGDLVLAGGGDPVLDTDGLAKLAAGMKSAGLREVRGDFLVYDGALPFIRSIDPGQPDHVSYSPAVSGMALNFNRVHFEWKRAQNGYAVTMQARTPRYRPAVDMARMQLVKRDLPVYTYEGDKGADHWTVATSALGKGGARWLPVRRPAAYAGDVFRTLARSHGIVLKPARATTRNPGGVALAEVFSPPLEEILRGMLKYSNNLTAEMVGMAASSARKGQRPTTLRASAQQMSRWAARRFDMKNTRLVDHSGLGDESRMTAEDLVGALVAVRRRGLLRSMMKPITVRDRTGRKSKTQPITVNAKTGTLNFVSGLGGFITTADGTEMAFAIFAADTDARARIKRADRDRPQGARGWNARAKSFQQQLISRWGQLYGS